MSTTSVVLGKIKQQGHCGGSYYLAWAYASTYNEKYKISIRKGIYTLDKYNKKLLSKLIFIESEHDYCEKEHMAAFQWLKSNKYLIKEQKWNY
jgi:hypothetical protein